MADKNYVDCEDCRKRYIGKIIRVDLCSSKEAIKYFGSLKPSEKIIPYTVDFNKNHDCKFIKLSFSGLLSKISSEI
jgi:hypothetical protein